jgi:hypothetical protein
MSDLTREYEELLGVAKAEARKAMGGQRVGIYDVDDIAQEMMVKFFLAKQKKVIEHPKAFLHELAFQCFTAALRREKRREMEDITGDVALEQTWEDGEIVTERIIQLGEFASNGVQRGIVLHVLYGFDVKGTDGRKRIARCAGVSDGALATELSRLKGNALKGVEPGRTVVPVCTGWCYGLLLFDLLTKVAHFGAPQLDKAPLGFDFDGGMSNRTP